MHSSSSLALARFSDFHSLHSVNVVVGNCVNITMFLDLELIKDMTLGANGPHRLWCFTLQWYTKIYLYFKSNKRTENTQIFALIAKHKNLN